MKPIRLTGHACLALLCLILNFAIAQGQAKNSLPQNVSAELIAHYPKARVVKYNQTDSGYKVKFTVDAKKYQASFDSQGDWLETVSGVSWQWHLPAPVKTGLRKSTHGTWHTYDVDEVETASQSFYRVRVDNTNHPVDPFHQLVLTENWEIDINLDGLVVAEHAID